jgi:hypothetical protein
MNIPSKTTVSLGILAGLTVGLALSTAKFYKRQEIQGKLFSILGQDAVETQFDDYSKSLREHRKAWAS